MADIFLSHERADRQRVARIAALLEASGWSVSWDAGPGAGPGAGMAEGRQSGHEVSTAGCVIVAWSLDATDSDLVWSEASVGFERGALISVSLDIAKAPAELCPAPPISLAGWTGDDTSPRAQELLAAVGALLAQARAQPIAARPDLRPDAGPGPASLAPAFDEPVRDEPVHAESAHDEAFPPAGALPETVPEAPAFTRRALAEPLARPFFDRTVSAAASSHDAGGYDAGDYGDREDTRVFEAFDADAGPALEERQEDTSQDTRQDAWDPAYVAEEPEQLGPAPTVLRAAANRVPSPPERWQINRSSLPAVLLGSLLVISIAIFSMKGWISSVLYTGSRSVSVAAPEPATAPEAAPQPAAGSSQQASPPQQTVAISPPPPKAATRPARPSQQPEVAPTPAALPNTMEIEDLLAQVSPQRVEQILVGARKLIRTGDIRAAREVLEVPETESSAVLTFMLAETYDPNILSAAQRDPLADSEHARQLYRKARDLGDTRAQQRLDSLKASDCQPKSSTQVASSGCGPGLPG